MTPEERVQVACRDFIVPVVVRKRMAEAIREATREVVRICKIECDAAIRDALREQQERQVPLPLDLQELYERLRAKGQ